MEKITLDKEKVKKVTDASRTATSTMIMLGFRQRAHAFTSLSTVKNKLAQMGEKIIDRDYMDFWRGLEDAGVGSIILGRRGKQTRFEWNYSLRQIASIAIEGKEDQIERLSGRRAKVLDLKVAPPKAPTEKTVFEKTEAAKPQLPEPKPVKSNSGVSKEERIVYTIQIRPGQTAEVSLPLNVSKDDLERVRESFFLVRTA